MAIYGSLSKTKTQSTANSAPPETLEATLEGNTVSETETAQKYWFESHSGTKDTNWYLKTDSGCRGLMREHLNYDKITEALWCFGVATQRFYCVLFFVSAYYNKFGMFCFSPYPVLVNLKVIQHYSKVSAIHIFNNKNIKRLVLIFMPSK